MGVVGNTCSKSNLREIYTDGTGTWEVGSFFEEF
jgi:hypothetical protein